MRCISGAVGLQDDAGVAASMLPAMDDSVDDDADGEESDHAGARGLDIEQGNQACLSLPLLKADLPTCSCCAIACYLLTPCAVDTGLFP